MNKSAWSMHSYAVGEGLRGHVLRQPTKFRIHASDRQGRSCFVGGDAFTVNIRGPSKVSPALTDNGDGTYEVQWEGSVTGAYLISVLLNGDHIDGSPYAARVVVPGHEPSQCRAGVAGSIEGSVSYPSKAGEEADVVHATAGGPAVFDISFNDALGRPVRMDPSHLRFSVTPWRSLEEALATSEACAVRAIKGEAGPRRIEHLAIHAEPTPSTYPEHCRRVSVSVGAAGSFLLHVVMQPKATDITKGSRGPLRLTVHPAAASAETSRCLATPRELWIRAGETNAFTLRGYDAYGNACDAGGAHVALAGAAIERGDVIFDVIDKQDGEYWIEWSSRAAGRPTVDITIDGVALPADVKLLVEPNCVCPETSVASGDGLTRAVAGAPTVLLVHGKDACGNSVLPHADVTFGVSLWDRGRQKHVRASDARTVTVEDADDTTPEVEAGGSKERRVYSVERERPCMLTASGVWLRDGVHEITYSCSLSGSYDLHLWYKDKDGVATELSASPHVLEVVPDAADHRGSLLVLDGPLADYEPRTHVLTAGTKLTAAVRVCDVHGNPTMPKDGELCVVLDGPMGPQELSSSSSLRVDADKAPGVHRVNEVLRRSGAYTLSATIRGSQAIGSPLGRVRVRAAPSEGAHSILVPPANPIVAGEWTTIIVHCRDRFGNPPAFDDLEETIADGLVAARIDGGPARIEYTLTPHLDGSVEIALLANISGTYRLNVWVGGSVLPPPTCPCLLSVETRPFLRSASPPGSPRSPRVATPRATSSSRDTSPTSAAASQRRFSPPRLRDTSPLRSNSPPRASPPRSLTRNTSSSAGGGYSPTSPHNSTSPAAWHGMWHTHPELKREDRAPVYGGSGSKAHSARLAALATPRTPPATERGRRKAAPPAASSPRRAPLSPSKSLATELDLAMKDVRASGVGIRRHDYRGDGSWTPTLSTARGSAIVMKIVEVE